MVSPNHDGAGRPTSAVASRIRSAVSPNRRAEQKMPSQPSPYVAARRTAASPEPPMTSGTRGSGGGRMRASLREKNWPWWSDGLARGQLPEHLERLVQPAASRRGIHAGVRDLAAVLASDTDPECQPGGRYLGDGRELSRRHHGVSQSREVDTDEHVEGVVGGEDRRCRHQAVEACAALEADVVTGGDVVQAGTGDVVEDPSPRRRVGDEQSLVDRHAQLRSAVRDAAVTALPPCPSSTVAMTRFWMPAVPSAIR